MREPWKSWGRQGGSWGRAQSCLEKWEALRVVLRILAPSDTRLQYCKDVLLLYLYLCVCPMCVEARGRPMVQFPGSKRITGGCEPHNTGPLEVSVCAQGLNHLYIPTHLKHTNRIWKKNGLSVKYISVDLVCQSHLSINKMKIIVKSRYS